MRLIGWKSHPATSQFSTAINGPPSLSSFKCTTVFFFILRVNGAQTLVIIFKIPFQQRRKETTQCSSPSKRVLNDISNEFVCQFQELQAHGGKFIID
ncbi:unnamed protein product [Lactuca virosa]|uniref:Uncharacterized protein n=1 Tax=Lactuca virosa TaxID=75947 RepID=A0AAU9P3V6_9ASTR|nr:unnamed protein product [Lactuca virosa]